MEKTPKVFIAYSHEESEHSKWVANLAADLRKNGVDASLDQWDLVGGQDVVLFMESQIRDSDFVVLVCTPLYAQKSNIPSGGVGFEKNIISAAMLQAKDLRPKFIPILRKGTLDDALPTYLGSKYAIDFREPRKYEDALGELLRVIFGEPHPGKPPLGKRPPLGPTATGVGRSKLDISVTVPKPYRPDINVWEKEALGRFMYLCQEKISPDKQNPFALGYWQASFVLWDGIKQLQLPEFLEILRASETNRTGWDIGWVPTRSEIAPYPYKDGIEVWLAEDGGKGPGHSDFWRAEPSGRFSLFRGYQEDGEGFPRTSPGKIVDFYLVLWRVSEFLLYIENFSRQIKTKDSKAILKINWNGLKNRKIGTHKNEIPLSHMDNNYICKQDEISFTYEINNCNDIKRNLLRDVHVITKPLFEAFNFFSVEERSIKSHIKGLFDVEKEVKD